jgi:hypothetical protein
MLVLEAFVLLFAALVAKDLSDLTTAQALLGGGVLALLCLLTAGLLRVRAGYWLGWALQLAMIATGLVVPMMFGIGVIFTALWVGALVTGTKIERERAYVAAALEARGATTGEAPSPP